MRKRQTGEPWELQAAQACMAVAMQHINYFREHSTILLPTVKQIKPMLLAFLSRCPEHITNTRTPSQPVIRRVLCSVAGQLGVEAAVFVAASAASPQSKLEHSQAVSFRNLMLM